MTGLSVIIITYNEEENISRCIDSVKGIADEVVVLDSLSTDNTVAIARERNAVIYTHPFEGYIENKNKALSLASYDYTLVLDADEVLSDQLAASIQAVKQKGFSGAYTMNRCTNYCGKFIRHGTWYPDKKLRLFNRHQAGSGGVSPHDKIILKEAQPVTWLKGDILHYSYSSIEEHIAQNNRFSSMAADAFFARGKKAGLFKIVINPLWAFTRAYFIRLGLLDGFYGFVIAVQVAHLTFLKYSKLYQKQRSIPA